jgi:SAM-dependent methyltransferase
MAFDLSGEMLAVARKKDYSCPVHFASADLYSMSIEKGAYDIVALGFWFSHHPRQDFDRLFDVLAKGLKPGGFIWMIDNNPPAEGPQIDSVRVDENGNNYKKRYLDNGREFVILKNYFSRNDLQMIFETRFIIKSLIYGHYYWSTVLSPKG